MTKMNCVLCLLCLLCLLCCRVCVPARMVLCTFVGNYYIGRWKSTWCGAPAVCDCTLRARRNRVAVSVAVRNSGYFRSGGKRTEMARYALGYSWYDASEDPKCRVRRMPATRLLRDSVQLPHSSWELSRGIADMTTDTCLLWPSAERRSCLLCFLCCLLEPHELPSSLTL